MHYYYLGGGGEAEQNSLKNKITNFYNNDINILQFPMMNKFKQTNSVYFGCKKYNRAEAL